MINVSKVNNQYVYGIIVPGEDHITISDDDFAKIQAGSHELVDDVLVEREQQEQQQITQTPMQWVKIPIAIARQPGVLEKKEEIKDYFSGITSTIEDDEGGTPAYQVLSNIELDRVSVFLTSQEYAQFTALGCIFSDGIQNMFQ